MTGRDLDVVSPSGETGTAAANGTIEVLYVDSDAASRETTRAVVDDYREDVRVSCVGTVDAALDVAEATRLSCLVVDPVGLDAPDRVLSDELPPVVLYTERDPTEIDDDLLGAVSTVVEKGDSTERRTFLAEKVVSIANAPVDRSEYALSSALSGIEARASDDEVAALVDDDGDIVWAASPLAPFVTGRDEAPPDTENFYDLLAAGLPASSEGRRSLDRLRDNPTSPVTFRVTVDGRDRYLLRRGYQLPAAAGALRLILLEDVTETARRNARMALLELLVDRAQDGLYTLDERGIIDFCNESFAENLGYEPDEIRGQHASEVLAPGELTKGQQTIETLLEDPDSQSTTVDLTFVRKDGTHREVSIHYTLICGEGGTYRGLMGVVRDITERRERERELKQVKERLELAVEGAEIGVWDWNPKTNDLTFNDRWAGMLGYERDELDACYETWADLVHPEDLERAEAELETLVDGETDLYQCDFRMRTKDGDLKWIRDIGKVFERDADGTPVRAVGIHQDITAQRKRQRALERQRDELATLHQVHVLIQDLIRALSEAATREEIEHTVCDRIVESDLYQFAWIGERTGRNDRLVPQVSAGDGGDYLDDIVVTADESATGSGPGGKALRTGTVQTVQDIETATDFEPWRDAALEQGFESVAAVPFVHGDVVHGVLCVYADRPAAFSTRAVESFTVLGEMIGFSVAAIQNRQLLTHDTVLELTFESTDAGATLVAVADRHDCRLESAGTVDIGSETLQYLTVEGAPPGAVLDSFTDASEVTDGRVVRADSDEGVVELQASESIQSLLLDVGARPREVVADGSGVSITVEAPTDADLRTVQQSLSSHVPGLSLVTKQEREREPAEIDRRSDPRDLLTDRQLEVVRTAFLAGYYAWPRDTTAEQLAETLDIASPTLHQHLRRAERNLIDGLFDV